MLQNGSGIVKYKLSESSLWSHDTQGGGKLEVAKLEGCDKISHECSEH